MSQLTRLEQSPLTEPQDTGFLYRLVNSLISYIHLQRVNSTREKGFHYSLDSLFISLDEALFRLKDPAQCFLQICALREEAGSMIEDKIICVIEPMTGFSRDKKVLSYLLVGGESYKISIHESNRLLWMAHVVI